ncbi:hypothetical protein MNBD_NITROSPINAE04-1908 [hydrothermal vent metagenome]|uniref:Uncharacterized protein n=1 Tax=hydrothermal vent metagenome TaxID=652676 RepID=A0A3B1CDN1_9ZZZZ
MRYRPFILSLALAFMSVCAYSSPAGAHWDMDARFWLDKKVENKFIFRIHNGSHANRYPVRRTLNVCFWIEGKRGGAYEPVSEKKCKLTDMKPDTWEKSELNVYDLAIDGSVKKDGKLRDGEYKVKVSAREQKNRFMRLLFGASLERLAVDVVVKDGHMKKFLIWDYK